MNRPIFLYLLYAPLIFLGIGATAGGGMLILKPDGSLLGMDPQWLDHSPFNDYLIPGLLLFTMGGLLPLFSCVGLLLKPGWKWANTLNIYSNRHWAWTYSLYSGIIVITWITVQLIMTQYFWLQLVMIFTGLLIIVLTLMPSVMKYYEFQYL
jgi:hypothetical protein